VNSSWSRFNVTSVVLGFAFLYLPIVLLVIFSFNESKLVTVWGGFSTKWYVSLFHNQGLMDAAWVTIRVGLVSATLATVLGTLAALALTRYTRFRGRVLFSGMVFAPLVMPEVITGLSLLLLFVAVGLDRGFFTLTLYLLALTDQLDVGIFQVFGLGEQVFLLHHDFFGALAHLSFQLGFVAFDGPDAQQVKRDECENGKGNGKNAEPP
jgi:ABC-type Fe3+ transport system permease subunit